MAANMKNAFNECKPKPYTKIADLHEDTLYRIMKMERVVTPYGQAVLVSLEGVAGDEPVLKVYLPRRYNEVLSPTMIEEYNSGATGSIFHLVRRAAVGGGNGGKSFTPLEIV